MAGVMARQEFRTGRRLRSMVLVAVFMAAVSSGIAGGGSGSSSSSSSSGSGVSKPPSSPNLCFASTSRGSPASRARSCSSRRVDFTTTISHCRRRPLPPSESGYYGVFSPRGAWSSFRTGGCNGGPRRTPAVSCSSGDAGTTTAAAAAAEGSGTLEMEGATSLASAIRGASVGEKSDGCVDSRGDPEAGQADGGAERKNSGGSSRGLGMLGRSMAATERFFARDRSSPGGDTGGQWRRRRWRRRRGESQESPAAVLGGGLKGNERGEGEGDLRVPRHVAFVMDGNGRWAAGRNMPRRIGHVEGALRAREAVEACRELGVEFVTLYAFSTENWSRPSSEVSFLMELMEKTLIEERESLRRNGIRLVAIGELHHLPARLRHVLEEIEGDGCGDTPPGVGGGATAIAPRGQGAGGEEGAVGVAPNGGGTVDIPLTMEATAVGTAATTKPNTATTTTVPTTMTLCLAVSYGGRAEVAAAARELAVEAAAGRLDPLDIDEGALGRRLSTARLGIPDPDLVVRTSGESRLSNLLLWQAAYAELCVVSKAWPEFHRPDLVETFRDFGRRRRRHGKTPEQVAEALENMGPQP